MTEGEDPMTEGEDQIISGDDNLLSDWTITSENIQRLRDLKSQDFQSLSFIGYVTKVNLKYSVFTANFQNVVNAIQSNFNVNGPHKCICLEGPKGCGKTHTLVATFVICSLLNERSCLFLAQDSFENTAWSIEYLKEFVKTCVHFPSDFRKEIESLLDKKESKAAIQTMLKSCEAFKKAAWLFVDLSCATLLKSQELIKLLAVFYNQYRIIISISSGARHSNDLYLKVVYYSCAYVEISRFTEDEATSFLKVRNVNQDLSRFVHLAGTNPFLLSFIREEDTIGRVTGIMESAVYYVLEKNFSNLMSKPIKLQEYFIEKEMLECLPIIKLANTGRSLTLELYEKSLLWKHLLLVAEDLDIMTKYTVFGATLADTSTFHAAIKKNTGFASYCQ